MTIRLARPEDTETLVRIARTTGASGADASELMSHPRILAEIYLLPYLAATPETCLVAEEDGRVVGYAVAARDTRAFEAWTRAKWWPGILERYPELPGWTRPIDLHLADLVLRHEGDPEPVVRDCPAHLHLNIDPAAQGRGLGKTLARAMLEVLRQASAKGVHVRVGQTNARGLGFWRSVGFTDFPAGPDLPATAIWLGQRLKLPAGSASNTQRARGPNQ